MTNEIINKICEINRLALQLNPKCTSRDVTGDKPTVFIQFSGHVNRFSVQLYYKGWDEKKPYIDECDNYYIFLDEEADVVISQLEEIVKTLSKLVEKWSNRNE